ncbi:MAG: hypothetical protein ACI4AE_03720 [Candidatus Cryptobacteroides sp.]
MKIKAIMVISLLAGSLSLANAQDVPALQFSDVNYGASSLARASASLTDISGISANPAAVLFSESKGNVALGYGVIAPDMLKTNNFNLDGAMRFSGRFGAGVSVDFNSIPLEIDGADFSMSQVKAAAGFAFKVSSLLGIGVNIGYASQSFDGSSQGALTADVFLMSKVGDLRVAAGVSNLGPKVESSDGSTFNLPSAAALGLGWGMETGDHNLDAQLDAKYYFHNAMSVAASARYEWRSMVSVCAGYRYASDNAVLPSFASVGAGVRFSGVSFNLAYLLASDTLSGTFALSVGYSF